MICAGSFSDGVPSTCFGDSGGPLVCLKDDQLYLAGVTSWTAGQCKMPTVPRGFAKVSSYLPWIKTYMESSTPPTTTF